MPQNEETQPIEPCMPDKWERFVAMISGISILTFIAALVWRNEPFSDPNLAVLARGLFSFFAAVLGATIPGFLRVEMNIRGIAIRAGGASALFVITYVCTPKILPFFESMQPISMHNTHVSDPFMANRLPFFETHKEDSLDSTVRSKKNEFITEQDLAPFPNRNEAYNILILPFDRLEDCTIILANIEETIKKRFIEMNEAQQLGLKVQFLKANEHTFTYKEGRSIGESYNADIVIWGDIFENCSSEHEGRLMYAVVKNKTSGINIFGKTNIESFELKDVLKGTLQNGIDNIVYWSVAMRHMERGDFGLAIEFFEYIVNKDNPHLCCSLGMAYLAYGDRPKAIKYLSKALVIDPKFHLAYNNRATAYMAQMKLEEAVSDLSEAISISPSTALYYRNRGVVFSAQNKKEKALKEYDHAIKLDPCDAKSFGLRALVHEHLGNLTKAIRDHTEALEIDPEDSLTYNNRGVTLSKQGHRDLAIFDYNKAIELDPFLPLAYTNRGLYYHHIYEIQKAINEYSVAIDIYPGFSSAYAFRGRAYQDLQNFQGAIDDYTKSIELDPSNYYAHFNLGRAHKLLGCFKDALLNYSNAIGLNPYSSEAYAGRASVFMILGNKREGLKDLNNAILFAKSQTK